MNETFRETNEWQFVKTFMPEGKMKVFIEVYSVKNNSGESECVWQWAVDKSR